MEMVGETVLCKLTSTLSNLSWIWMERKALFVTDYSQLLLNIIRLWSQTSRFPSNVPCYQICFDTSPYACDAESNSRVDISKCHVLEMKVPSYFGGIDPQFPLNYPNKSIGTHKRPCPVSPVSHALGLGRHSPLVARTSPPPPAPPIYHHGWVGCRCSRVARRRALHKPDAARRRTETSFASASSPCLHRNKFRPSSRLEQVLSPCLHSSLESTR